MIRKVIITTAILFCSCCEIIADYPHRSFLKDGKVWNCKMFQSDPPNSYTEYYKNVVRGDSLLNGVAYFKMYRETEGSCVLDFYALWREDGGKVYAYVPADGSERLMYDFSALPGSILDDIEGERVWVNKTFTCMAEGQHFNGLSLSIGGYYEFLWVEGVGSSYGPGYPVGPQFTNGLTTEMLSCYEDGECIFTADDFESVDTGVESLLSESKIWTMRYHLSLAPDAGDVYKFSEYRLAEESIINGIPFKRVQARNRDDGEEYPDEWKDAFFSIRQENGKVYITYNNRETFAVMDFSLKKGDTFVMAPDPDPYSQINFYVTEVTDTVLVNSTDKTPRKCLHLQVGDMPGMYEVWIEGIGSLYGGLEGVAMYYKAGSVPNLMSCTDEDQVLYKYSDPSGISVQHASSGSIRGDAPIYNLQGQRVESVPRKGVYIQNGKKVVIK